jgi:cytochrome c553
MMLILHLLRYLARGAVLLAFLAPPFAFGAGDVGAGERKAEPCLTCHGSRGNSTTSGVPSLAAQPPLHTYYQLLQYREKRRIDPEMSPEAATLSDRDMQDLAAYFAAQKAAAPGLPADPQKAALGRDLADRYHCHSCHKPDLTGQNHIPRLAGQHYEYLVKQLRGFKAGTRPDIDGNMASSAQPLTDQDIESLAHYLSSLK